MNQQLIEQNRKKLDSEASRIRAVLSRSGDLEGKGEFPGEYKPKFTEAGREEGENASEVEQYATDLAITQDLESKLANIEAALKRIADGTYGKCKMGDEIEEERLEALPEAETCIKHADA